MADKQVKTHTLNLTLRTTIENTNMHDDAQIVAVVKLSKRIE